MANEMPEHEERRHARLESTPYLGFAFVVPLILFVASWFIPPSMYSDSGYGFLALRSMLDGGPFNTIIGPDSSNIAHDTTSFLTWWSPGQYLIPGIFVAMGANYGLAISLTVLVATLVGVVGWAQLARSFSVSPYLVFVFVFALVTFRYATLPFRIYNGGEVLLFAAAPWSLYFLRWSITKPIAVTFLVTLFSVAILFLAKLTGLIVFAANVLAISLLDIRTHGRLRPEILSVWSAAAIGAFSFFVFWKSRGAVPASGTEFAFSLEAVLFPIAGVAFSGLSGLDFVARLFLHPSNPLITDLPMTSIVLGPLGLVPMVWVWRELRHTDSREMVVCLFSVIVIYAVVFMVMYTVGSTIGFDGRYFLYAGILFLLLFIVAVDRSHRKAVKYIAIAVIASAGAYGLSSYVFGVRDLARGDRYDPVSGTSQLIVPPSVLNHLNMAAAQDTDHPVVVLPSPEAAMGLSRARVIAVHLDFEPIEMISSRSWTGRADSIYVVVQERMLGNGKSEALLRSFVDYEYGMWNPTHLDGMVIFAQ